MITWLLPFLKSWKLWGAATGVAAILAALWWFQHQSAAIASLESAVDAKEKQVATLEKSMEEQKERHAKELAAVDASLKARRESEQQAEQRAGDLARQLRNARNENPELDACLGTELPSSVVDRLPK